MAGIVIALALETRTASTTKIQALSWDSNRNEEWVHDAIPKVMNALNARVNAQPTITSIHVCNGIGCQNASSIP